MIKCIQRKELIELYCGYGAHRYYNTSNSTIQGFLSDNQGRKGAVSSCFSILRQRPSFINKKIKISSAKAQKGYIMIKVYDRFTGESLIKRDTDIPNPGVYYSIITDACMAIISPFYKKEDTCFVVKYKLVSVSSLEESEFIETYYPYRSSPRSHQFFSYLHKHFSVPYGEDEAIIGLREKLEINWDVLGGYAYPVVSHRWFIDLPQSYKENYLNEQEEDIED